MTWGAVAVGGATLISGYMGSKAAKSASATQAGATQAGIAEQQRQFDEIQKLLAPYAEAGTQSLGAQKALVGLGQPGEMKAAIDQIKAGPQFQSMLQQGENSILQNAAATGGLRGGNTQAALAQFSPNLLAQLIQQRFQNLSGITAMGESAAAGTGSAGQTTASNVSDLIQQGAAATAGGQLAQAKIWGNTIGDIAGVYSGYKKGKF